MKQLQHYKTINVENWNPYHVFSWIAETAVNNKLSYHTFNARKYNQINGRILKEMTQETFEDLAQSREAGIIIFEAKQKLFDPKNKIKRLKGRPPKEPGTCQKAKDKPYGKIWEFVGKLLLDKNTCPSLIKWDDCKAGTFKFVQPKKVAELWGLRKNNTKMNYNKFTRALRYHYKKGYLISVEEKRLVYKFGPKAIKFTQKFKNMS